MARILFLTERFPPDIGGLAASSARISKCIAALGHTVDVLAWSRHVPAGKLVEQKLDDCPEKFTLFRHGLYRQWDMSMPTTLNVFDWLHSLHNYDLVWGHYLAPAGFLAVWFAQLNSIKSIVSARGNDVDTAVFPPGDLARLTWTLERANVVSSVSEDLAKKIRVISARPDIEVITNSVDSEIFSSSKNENQQLKATLGIKPDELVLGFAGELREKKGIQFLLDAFREVRAQRPCCLLVIGDVRSHQKPSVQLFSAEFPEDAARMIITGHIEDPTLVADHLRLCDVYLQPSLMEGMPNSLLEAMACSRLCITSDAGGIPELIEHEKNGFMLPRAMLNNLGTAILEACDLDATFKQSLCAAARATVESRFSLQRERAQLDDLLKRVLNNSEYDSQSSFELKSKV
ncbi:MAG: glycosyltransferase family 4 protein [Candidatus Obscuribacterales bacterium]|nr:glycosyltransferase family 4 protein [Candidatus Obscuribacterales bacterium]